MKKEFSVLLSGLGYYRLSEQRRKLLGIVLLISLGVHLLGLLVFGSVVVMRAFREETTVFKVPPPMKTYQPRQLEHRVKVQKMQRSSSRPSVTPRLVSQRVSKFALPDIVVDPKVVKTSFQPKFKAISGKGMGIGMGTGYGVGGFGQGVSSFDFFGIRGSGDRIALLMDVSVSMAEEDEKKGVTDKGIEGFQRVKDRISRVIDALSEQSVFNVIAFANTADAWSSEMRVANAEAKSEAKRWLRPFNTSNNLGLSRGTAGHSKFGLQTAVGGQTRLDLAITEAFKLGADTILIISDGLPRVMRNYTDEERAAQQKAQERWQKQNASALKSNSSAQTTTKREKVWVEGKSARAAVIKEGKRIAARKATKGHWEYRMVSTQRGGNRPRLTPRPNFPEPMWQLSDFTKHMELLQEGLNKPKGRRKPVVHCIGYRIDKDGSHFLRALAREYKGQYLKVSKIN